MKFSLACVLIRSNSKVTNYLVAAMLLILFFAAACSSHPHGPPRQGVMKSDRFVELLVDLHYADGLYDGIIDIFSYVQNPEHDTLDFYRQVYEKYDINREIFNKTMKYYSHNPFQFEAIYDRVVDKLNKRMMMEQEELFRNPDPDNTGKL